MGIDLVTWRSQIGTFNGCDIFKRQRHSKQGREFDFANWLIPLVTILVIVAGTQGNQHTTGLNTDVQLTSADNSTTPVQTIWFSASNVTCFDLNIPVGYNTIPTNISLNVYKQITTLTFQTLPVDLMNLYLTS